MSDSTELVPVNEMAAVRAGLSSAVAELKKKCETSMAGSVGLHSVPTEDKGWVWDSEHTVTGRELNVVIAEIDKIFADFFAKRRDIWGNFVDVYKTIDGLDRDYLSKIEKSFEQINSNYERIKSNNREIRQSQVEIENHRKRIDKLIQSHEIALKVLRQFKGRIDKLAHLEEINNKWEKIDIENSLKQVNQNYQIVLRKLEQRSDAIDALDKDVKAINKRILKWVVAFSVGFVMAAVACVLLIVYR